MNIKLSRFYLRILSGIIDMMIILLPMMMISLYLFQFSLKLSEIYAQGVFLIYNVLFVDLSKGQTLGKKISREHVVFCSSNSEPLIKKAIRESCKLLYFLPVIGIFFCVISVIIYMLKGNFLHDLVGDSQVIPEKEYIKEYI